MKDAGKLIAVATSSLARAQKTIDPELRGLLLGISQRRQRQRSAERQPLELKRKPEPATVENTLNTAVKPGARAAITVLERRDVAPGLIIVKINKPHGFAFRAGQHVKFGTSSVQRTYTIVSSPREQHLEFFIEQIPGGRLSTLLKGVRAGNDVVVAARAKGSFFLKRNVINHLLVATVTGIAPYISLLRDYFASGDGARQRFIVLHGASFANEFGYDEELLQLQSNRPDNVCYIPTVSQSTAGANQGWKGATGRVESNLQQTVDSFKLSPSDTAIYACGNPGMIKNVGAFCRAKNFTFSSEAYD